MKPRVVAIDGAAGSGKSTLARRLAASLGLAYVNTGLMYRALTAAAIRGRVSVEDEDALLALIDGLRFRLEGSNPPELTVEGWSADDLVTAEVEADVSSVARHERVRSALRTLQRRSGLAHGAVMEGRDIGSVVFRDAPVKLYLEADPAARARRRSTERGSASHEGGKADALHLRDRRDASTTPHEPASGAFVIDTTMLDVEQTLAAALAVVADLAPDLLP